MTMHLAHPALTMGGKRKGKTKFRNSAEAQKARQLDADFEGELTIKGKKLTEMFEKIEERLAILHPNPELEDRWDELKDLAKRYKELEQEIIEKEKVWAILKK